jgi:hypothetical protein
VDLINPRRKMIKSILLALGFMISSYYATQASQKSVQKNLADFAAILELNKMLAHHLESGAQLCREVFFLRMSLVKFEEAFYRREVLASYCDDPTDYQDSTDILSAAFRKDLENPLSVGFDLNLLPLEEIDVELGEAKSSHKLKRIGRFDEVAELVKSGRLHFKPNPKLGYAESVNAHVKKLIISKMRPTFDEVIENRRTFNTDLPDVCKNYLGKVRVFNILTARDIYIDFPYIKKGGYDLAQEITFDTKTISPDE